MPWYFFKLTQPLTVSTVHILYTVTEKGGKPEIKPYPLWFQKSIQKPQVWELSRLCPETSTNLYVHEFHICTVFDCRWVYALSPSSCCWWIKFCNRVVDLCLYYWTYAGWSNPEQKIWQIKHVILINLKIKCIGPARWIRPKLEPFKVTAPSRTADTVWKQIANGAPYQNKHMISIIALELDRSGNGFKNVCYCHLHWHLTHFCNFFKQSSHLNSRS